MTVTARAASEGVRSQVARWLSSLGHPFILTTFFMASLTFQTLPPGRALLVTGIVFAGAILPTVLLLVRQVRTGRCSDFDVSVREERSRIYLVAVVNVLVTLLVLAWLRPPREILGGSVAVLVLLGTASLINLRHKISLHTSFAVLVALSLLPLGAMIAGGGAALAAAIGWSRVATGRHTPAEVASGIVLGTLVGMGFLLWQG